MWVMRSVMFTVDCWQSSSVTVYEKEEAGVARRVTAQTSHWHLRPGQSRHSAAGGCSPGTGGQERYHFHQSEKNIISKKRGNPESGLIHRSGPLRLHPARRTGRDRYNCLKRTISRKGLWPRPEDCANWLQDCLLNCDLFEMYRRGFRTENLFYNIDIGWIQ